MTTPTSLDTLPCWLLDRILQQCQSSEAEPLAVLVTGSYAVDRAAPGSDLDLTTLLRREPEVGYRTWFEDRPGRVLHVSAGFECLDDWLRDADEPSTWSLGFPTESAACFLWSTPEARTSLPDPPSLQRPAGSPELEDFVEAAIKARRALASNDHLGARFHAHSIGWLAPRLLIPLNQEWRVHDRREAMEAALSLPLAPEHYRDDLIGCLGLQSLSDPEFERAALRLPVEMLAFLRTHRPDIDPQPWLGRYLLDGTLERHLLT
jgi:phosphoribosyl-AMP cyclohydrolase